MAEKTRYSDAELEEFKALILDKLEKAKRDYELLKANITHSDDNDTMDTSPTFKVLEEGRITSYNVCYTKLLRLRMKQNISKRFGGLLRNCITKGYFIRVILFNHIHQLPAPG